MCDRLYYLHLGQRLHRLHKFISNGVLSRLITVFHRVRIIKKWNYLCLSDWKKKKTAAVRTWLMTFTIYSGQQKSLFFAALIICVRGTKYIWVDNEIRKSVACVGEWPFWIEYCINEQKNLYDVNFYHFHCLSRVVVPYLLIFSRSALVLLFILLFFCFDNNFSKFSYFSFRKWCVYLCVRDKKKSSEKIELEGS